MEVEIHYIARDGRRFTDPLLCEDYEKQLDFPSGTVGRAKKDLHELGENKFVSGLLCVHKDGSNYWYNYTTMEVSHWLEDCLNIHEKPQWVKMTIADVLDKLNNFEDDVLCEYNFIYSENYDFSSSPFGVCFMRNPMIWEKRKMNTGK